MLRHIRVYEDVRDAVKARREFSIRITRIEEEFKFSLTSLEISEYGNYVLTIKSYEPNEIIYGGFGTEREANDFMAVLMHTPNKVKALFDEYSRPAEILEEYDNIGDCIANSKFIVRDTNEKFKNVKIVKDWIIEDTVTGKYQLCIPKVVDKILFRDSSREKCKQYIKEVLING